MSSSPITRRSFLALAASAAADIRIHAASAPAVPARAGAISLAGPWRFAIDREDAGMQGQWFDAALPGADHIALPGILQTQGFGDEIAAETAFVAALPRDMAWYKLPQYAAYTKPGHVKVPYLSQPVRHYLGVAWYQREIDVPQAWSGKRVVLTLERTRWETKLYIDDKAVGHCSTLVAPHVYDLGLLAPGRHRLSLRIDNRMILPYRPDGHSVSDAEGSTWNGVVGRIELHATSPVWIEDAQVYPDIKAMSAKVKVKLGNASGRAGRGMLRAGSTQVPVQWSAAGGEAELTLALPKAGLWSEFTPTLQRVELTLRGEQGSGPAGQQADDSRELVFGMREIKVDGKHIRLNGELLNMRGTHDAGGFPLTGYPATDVASWKRIIGICKAWGFNAIRFHSWCPPEAAFVAADELGFYLQPDCGMWNAFDTEGHMLAVLEDETTRLLAAFGNHPSMIMLNATNEPAGHYNEQLPVWDRTWRAADPRRLYADGTGRPALPAPGQPWAADYVVSTHNGAQRTQGRGPSGWFGADYEAVMGPVTVPAIGHETGQWCAYPDFRVIDKFKGYLVPGNYEIWRDAAAEHHLLAKNQQLAHASGRFQLACYKEEIEASQRTPSYSGYQLLDLHDYLGQGGALCGVLDPFWESKGYATAEEYRRFNGETVLLARLKERVYSTTDTLRATVEVSHFGAAPLPTATCVWKIVSDEGRTVSSDHWPARAIARGKGTVLGEVAQTLTGLPAPARYRLMTELHDARGVVSTNEWNFWLYPARGDDHADDALITRDWNEAEAALRTGGRVLFTPDAAALGDENPKMTSVPIFWNRLMNPGGAWMLGLLCDARHPALKGFPTEAHCDWQWIDIAGDARAMNLDALPAALEPIVQPIDDWNRSWKLGLLFECRVGNGRLMVCSIALDATKPGARALRRSVLDYMGSPAFKPATAVEATSLRTAFAGAAKHDAKPVGPTSPDLEDPGQIKKPQH